VNQITKHVKIVEENKGCRKANLVALSYLKNHDHETYLVKHPFSDKFQKLLTTQSFFINNTAHFSKSWIE